MRKTTRTLAGLGLTLLLLTGCDNFQPAQKVKIQPAAVPPAQEKTWTVVVDGRIPVKNLKRKTSADWNSAAFETPDGKEIKFFGNFYMLEE